MDYNKKTNKLEIAQEKIITKNVIGGSDGCQVLKTEQILFVAFLHNIQFQLVLLLLFIVNIYCLCLNLF